MEVFNKAVYLYNLDPKTGLVYFKPEQEKLMIPNKQYAIMEGDWLLVKFPQSERTKLDLTAEKPISQLQTYTLPSFLVLANLRMGKWTMEFDNEFAKHAPVADLKNRLQQFFKNEIVFTDNSAY